MKLTTREHCFLVAKEWAANGIAAHVLRRPTTIPHYVLLDGDDKFDWFVRSQTELDAKVAWATPNGATRVATVRPTGRRRHR